MHRRQFLALTAAGALAGCGSDTDGSGAGGDGEDGSGDGSDGEPTPSPTPTSTPTATPTATATPTETAEPASFEVVNVDAPAEAEINAEWTFSLTVRNTGGQDGTFSTPVTVETSQTDPETVGVIELDVPAGEERTWESNAASYPYITEITYTLVEYDTTIEVQMLTRTLSFGEEYRMPGDVVLTVSSIELQNSYTYEDFRGDQATEEASDGDQFAFVNLQAENDSGGSEFVPFSQDFTIRVDTQQYDEAYIRREEGKYEGGEVGPGVVREGWVAYEIPADLSVDDLTVEYFDDDFQNEWGVRWSS